MTISESSGEVLTWVNETFGLLSSSGRLVEHNRGLSQIYNPFGLAGARVVVVVVGPYEPWSLFHLLDLSWGRQAELVLSSVS